MSGPAAAVDRADRDAAASALYRRVWRWHFYAGLFCLPFLVMLAITGGLYLFRDAVEARLYAPLFESRGSVPTADAGASDLVARAVAAQSGTPVRYVGPAAPGRSAEVGVRTARGVVAVYVEPADGRVLGTLADADRLMEVVKRIHSLAIAGPVGNHAVEVVAGWAIVLVVSGVFLWWPRRVGGGGVWRLRGRPRERRWWRDVHAVTGAVAGVAILFLAVTGMPWSAFWGERFGALATAWGVGVPPQAWGAAPTSTLPAADALRAAPWAIGHAPAPSSSAPSPAARAPVSPLHHDVVGTHPVPAPAAPDSAPRDIGLDEALRRFAAVGVPPGTPVRLPDGPGGVYTAMRFPDDVRDIRVVHLDRYSGAVLADIAYADYGGVGRAVEWGVSLHTGRQFGWPNQLVMLAACVSIVVLATSAAVMWWWRRPRGRLAAPPRRAGDRAAYGALAVAVLLGAVYPLLGASMLAAAAVDALLPDRWRERYGL